MKPETVDAIHADAQGARVADDGNQRAARRIYGLLPSGQFKPTAEYPVLGSIRGCGDRASPRSAAR
jgi:hypothetical protein